MAADLAHEDHSGLDVQLCGDAHLVNFGGFASPERDLIFDVNDFDETIPGPFEWDLKRLAASIEVAGPEPRASTSRAPAVDRGAGRRCATAPAMREFAGKRDLDIWYSRLDADAIARPLGARGRPQVDRQTFQQQAAKAQSKDHLAGAGQADRRRSTAPSGSRATHRC